VYLAVMLMLHSPLAGAASREVADLLAVPGRTVKRWQRWWERDFQRTRFWQSVRERLVPPLPSEGLPQSLLERFQGSTCHERMAQMLRFLSPLSTAFVSK
jgi:hypothetical protein